MLDNGALSKDLRSPGAAAFPMQVRGEPPGSFAEHQAIASPAVSFRNPSAAPLVRPVCFGQSQALQLRSRVMTMVMTTGSAAAPDSC
jgi:hypothetical protein